MILSRLHITNAFLTPCYISGLRSQHSHICMSWACSWLDKQFDSSERTPYWNQVIGAQQQLHNQKLIFLTFWIFLPSNRCDFYFLVTYLRITWFLRIKTSDINWSDEELLLLRAYSAVLKLYFDDYIVL